MLHSLLVACVCCHLKGMISIMLSGLVSDWDGPSRHYPLMASLRLQTFLDTGQSQLAYQYLMFIHYWFK